MTNTTKKVLDILKSHNVDTDSVISEITEIDDNVDRIKIGNTYYNIYAKTDDANIEELAAFIYYDMPPFNNVEVKTKTEEVVPIQESVDFDNVEVGKVYLYEPVNLNFDDDDLESMEYEAKLADLAKLRPFCKVVDILIVSKEEKDGFVLVNFNIPENKNLGITTDEDFVVFSEDLVEPIQKHKEYTNDKAEDIREDYYPTDVNQLYEKAKSAKLIHPDNPKYIVQGISEELDDFVAVEVYDTEDNETFDKYLGEKGSFDALKNLYLMGSKDTFYEISDDLYKEILEYIKPEEKQVSESITDNTVEDTEIETSTALLTALNSEKEAVVTYEMLLKLSEDDEEKKLLTKILADEKEHIALLSALQSSKTANSVAEDNKDDLNSYAEDVINTPPAQE